MIRRWFLFMLLAARISWAQADSPRVIPKISTITVNKSAVTVLYLAPGFITSVRLPEEVSSVVVGDPAGFKAEHSESEPRLVFLKPLSSQPAVSNALITTRTGREISLQLVSNPDQAAGQVDFLVEYGWPQGLLVSNQQHTSFLIAETKSVLQEVSQTSGDATAKVDLLAQELAQQRGVSSPIWQGKELAIARGEVSMHDFQMHASFSVLNRSGNTVELLSPQLELTGTTRRGRTIKGEPVAVSEFRFTSRRLSPGQRADGVVVFERPAFKQSKEQLRLIFARADQVDRPVRLPINFTSQLVEVHHESH